MKFSIALAAAALLLSGCTKKNDSADAVKEGVIRDLTASKSFNMASMDVTVDNVTFRGDEADAQVTFSLKGGPKDQGMAMKYVMERHSDGLWYIKSRASGMTGMAAGAEGGSGGNLPAGHPSLDSADTGMGGGSVGGGIDLKSLDLSGASGSKMPAGHPATSGQ